MRRRHELTDAQWERIKDLLPGKASDSGRTAADNRSFVNAVLYVLRTGIPCEDLPQRFGKPNTVWKRYDRWCAAGVWQRINAVLGEDDENGEADAKAGEHDLEEVEEVHEEVQLASSSVKAYPTASTGRRLPLEKKRTPTLDAAWAGPAVG